MFWADRLVDDIVKTGKYRPYHVDDMKTPSGRIHVGALRGVIVHDLLHKLLLARKRKSTYTYVMNDMDPMDGFPTYLPEEFRAHMGKPLFQVPSPEPGHESMARCYGEQFVKVFNSLGAAPTIIWSSEEYRAGKFDAVIREALDHVEKIRRLYTSISGYKKPKSWYPFQPICPKCGKVGTTIVTDWDGKEVTFECKKDLVKWAQGCGYTGKVSPFGGTGKLMWKMDWAAHWKVLGVTIEAAGKDHMAATGSHDLSTAICKQVFGYEPPYGFAYEWFLARGGAKMSSSKGIGSSAVEIAAQLPAELLRFLLVKSPYRQAIVFDPANNDSILKLYDEYDASADAYYKNGKETHEGRAWELSQIGTVAKKNNFRPRFRDIVKQIQLHTGDIQTYTENIKGEKLTAVEIKELNSRMDYARLWLNTFAPESARVDELSGTATTGLSDDHRRYLRSATELFGSKEWTSPEELQQALYNASKELGIPAKTAFSALYLALTGKQFGPKAAWFLLSCKKEDVLLRLKQAAQK